MRFFLLFILVLSMSTSLLAQQWQLKVQVQDAKKQALAYTNVLLSGNNGQVVAFAISDETGSANFQLDHPASELWLTGSLLGYTSDTLSVQAKPETQQLILPMRVSAFDLQEVQIEDYKLPYKVAGDTTSYEADKYAQGHERNVEALIKKMPGVEVDKDGKIHYKGKPVSRVLLEDDAIFGSKYAIATKSMSADVVDEVQFIDHYLENQLLNGIQDSDELVMNIKVKEDRKKMVFGSAHLIGGLPDRYNGRLNLFSLVGKHKTVALANASKRSNGNFSPYDFFRGNSAFDGYDYARPASDWVSLSPNVPNELSGQDFNNNNTQLGATNLILNPNKKVKIRGYLTAFNDLSRIRNQSFFKELFLEETFELLEKQRLEQATKGIDFNIETIIQTSDQSNLSINSMAYRGRENGQMQQFISGPRDSLTALQTLDGQNQTQRHRLNFVRKLNKQQALILKGTFYQNQKPNTFGFVTPQNEAFLQQLQHRTQDLDLEFSLLGKKENFSYQHSALVQNQTDFLSQQLLQDDLDLSTSRIVSSAGRHFQQQKLGVRTQLNWENKRLTYGISAEGGSINLQLPEQALTYQMLPYYNVGAQLTSKVSRTLTGIVSYKFGQRFPGVQLLNDLKIYQNNRSVTQGLGETTNIPSHTLIANIQYMNISSLIESYLNIVVGRSEQSFGRSYRYEGLTYLSQTALLDHSKRLSATWEIDKFFQTLSTNFSLRLNYNQQETPMLDQQLVEARVRAQQVALRFSATTATQGWINLNIQVEASSGVFQRLDQEISNQKDAFSNNQRWLTMCELFIQPHEKWSIDPALRYYVLPSQSAQRSQQAFGLGDLMVYYDWKDNCSLSLGVYNIFNSGTFTQETINTQSYYRQSLFLNRRAFELGLTIQL